ncbi:hypothetical protein [Phenylobacterium sp.]|jgi:hypothetical protein|uniref:hypothetical protein n=1 Tax=Phenylobacterium sp. TaxID=1871053 RepID=UPI0037CA3386
MTALLVISTSKPQPHLVKRRYAYREHIFGDRYCYVREEHNSPDLMRRDKDRIEIMPKCLEDIRSIQPDPTATVFAIEQNHGESIDTVLQRGHEQPLSPCTGAWRQLNTARYRAGDF